MCACLLGIPCNYKAEKKVITKAWEIFKKNECLLVCPEILGGLDAPRKSCEIVGGDGKKVLEGKIKVLDINGKDYTIHNPSGNVIPFGYHKIIPNMGLTRESHTGNLIIHFNVTFPETLSKEAIDKLKEIL